MGGKYRNRWELGDGDKTVILGKGNPFFTDEAMKISGNEIFFSLLAHFKNQPMNLYYPKSLLRGFY